MTGSALLRGSAPPELRPSFHLSHQSHSTRRSAGEDRSWPSSRGSAISRPGFWCPCSYGWAPMCNARVGWAHLDAFPQLPFPPEPWLSFSSCLRSYSQYYRQLLCPSGSWLIRFPARNPASPLSFGSPLGWVLVKLPQCIEPPLQRPGLSFFSWL